MHLIKDRERDNVKTSGQLPVLGSQFFKERFHEIGYEEVSSYGFIGRRSDSGIICGEGRNLHRHAQRCHVRG